MKFYDAQILKDAKAQERRYRNILANSGQIMESGEIRDIENLYVMGRDGTPIKISTLNTNPDKQTEDYTVKAQADHGELVDGELVDTIEKQFGSCKVWMESDGLHARMYFANDDRLADHAWAISEDASYSTGITWYPDGYYGAGAEINEPIGILREISMVLTGNDPRTKTIDHIEAETVRANGSEAEEAEDGNNNKVNEEVEMTTHKDELTPDENAAFKREIVEKVIAEINEAVDDFTTKVPESETEPTAAKETSTDTTKDDAEDAAPAPTEEAAEAPAEEKVEEKAEETKDSATVHNININFHDRAIKQESVVATKDTKAMTNEYRLKAIKDALTASNGHFNAIFEQSYKDSMSKVASKDAITGLSTPVDIANIFTEAMEKADGILSYINHIGGKGLRNNALAGTADYGNEAQGFKKGDTKIDETITDTIRVVYNKMVYKKLALDALEIYENPALLDFRARELADQIILSKERAIFIGDGRTAPSGSDPDLRMFDSSTNTGLFPIAADCAAQSGYGSLVASTYTMKPGENLYDGIVGARQWLLSEGEQFLVVKPSVLTAAFQAKVGNRYLIEPGATAEDIFRVGRVFAPRWMEYDTVNDAYLVVRDAYATTGENNLRVHPFFDVSTNQDILLDEAPTGGTLVRYKSAVAIKSLSESE